MDFAFTAYRKILKQIKESDWNTITLENYNKSLNKVIILRHDVDRKPQNALSMAKLEASLGIKSSYYFRVVPESYDENVIKQIVELGHEIGYHYENLSTAQSLKKKEKRKKIKGKDAEGCLYEMAIKDFELNLKMFKRFYPVKTMCMHGSPMSKWDNRKLWEKYDYHKYGIICEPYFDLDFNKVFYITDAGRSWNNERVSVRDKVESNFNIKINSTDDIIKLLESKSVPNQIMISTHPHNWSKNNMEWWKIFLWQNFKNVAKRIIIFSSS